MRPSLLFSVCFLSPCFFLYLLGSFEVTVTSVSLPAFVSRRGLSNTNQRLSLWHTPFINIILKPSSTSSTSSTSSMYKCPYSLSPLRALVSSKYRDKHHQQHHKPGNIIISSMKTHKHLSQLIASAIDHDLPLPSVIHPCLCPPLSHPSDLVLGVAMNTSAVMPFRASSHHPHNRGHIIPFSSFFLCVFVQCCRRRTLKSTFHPAIFWEMVKFVDLGVLYFSLVLPRQSRWTAGGPEWILRSLGGVRVS